MTQMARRIEGTGGMVHMDDDAPAQFPAQIGVQRTQTKYTTAIQVQQPRALPVVEKRSLDEASLLGADAYYAWGTNKDRVEGPSKELAMALVRCYGNCAVDLGEVQETRDAWIFTATFVDLETGFTLARQFRQSKKWTVYGKFDEARKEDIRFQIGQSKAVRNVILNALPGWLVKRAMDKAKGGVKEKIEQLIAAAQGNTGAIAVKYVARLVKLGATEARVLAAMGRPNVPSLTLEDLVILAGGVAALEAGQDTADNLFPEVEAENPQPPQGGSTSKAAALADQLGNATPVGAHVDTAVQDAAAKVEQRRAEAKAAASNADRERWPERKSPAAPGYWRAQALAKARSYVEAFPTEAADNTPEEIVKRLEDGHAEPVKRIPGPADKPDEKAVVQQYKDALAFLDQSPDHWARFVVPL